MTEAKVRENRLRSMAEGQGCVLLKSRRDDPNAADFERYWLIDMETDGVVFGDHVGVGLDEIEACLNATR